MTSLVVSLEMLMTGLGFPVEPGAVRVYVHLCCLYGLYRVACEYARIYPYALRMCLRVLCFVVWLFTPVIAACENLPGRWGSVHQRQADCVGGGPPMKLGYFRWNGKDFVRHHDLSTSRVRLTGGTTTIDSDGLETTSSRWEIIEPAAPADLSPGESALNGLSSTARPADRKSIV